MERPGSEELTVEGLRVVAAVREVRGVPSAHDEGEDPELLEASGRRAAGERPLRAQIEKEPFHVPNSVKSGLWTGHLKVIWSALVRENPPRSPCLHLRSADRLNPHLPAQSPVPPNQERRDRSHLFPGHRARPRHRELLACRGCDVGVGLLADHVDVMDGADSGHPLRVNLQRARERNLQESC